jgi:hypothetical protein
MPAWHEPQNLRPFALNYGLSATRKYQLFSTSSLWINWSVNIFSQVGDISANNNASHHHYNQLLGRVPPLMTGYCLRTELLARRQTCIFSLHGKIAAAAALVAAANIRAI